MKPSYGSHLQNLHAGSYYIRVEKSRAAAAAAAAAV
jgi:hypothetical protein